ncbi:MAG: EVE domain-containing protein [Pseudomonadales bacterium]
MREDPRFAECLLLRQPRLSAMPITAAEWSAIHEIAGTAMT